MLAPRVPGVAKRSPSDRHRRTMAEGVKAKLAWVRTLLRRLRKNWRTVAHWVVVGAALGYLAYLVPGLAHDVDQAAAPLEHVRWHFVLLAVVSGVSALVVYGELHRELLTVGGARVKGLTVQGINFVENAVSTTVPVVGGAGAIVYAIDQLRRRGVDAPLASWSVLLAGVLATLTLVVLGAIGLGVSGRLPLGLGLALAALIMAGAAGVWKVLTHPAVLRRVLRPVVWVGRHLPGRCGTCRQAWATHAEQVVARLANRIALLRPSLPRWAGFIVLAALTWVLDYATLAISVAAVGSSVPWGVLLVGFLLVQGSIALQILPGGVGLAETSLLALLLASGVAAATATASVLIYRSISWLGLSLLGWILYGVWIHTAPIHLHRHAVELSRA